MRNSDNGWVGRIVAVLFWAHAGVNAAYIAIDAPMLFRTSSTSVFQFWCVDGLLALVGLRLWFAPHIVWPISKASSSSSREVSPQAVFMLALACIGAYYALAGLADAFVPPLGTKNLESDMIGGSWVPVWRLKSIVSLVAGACVFAWSVYLSQRLVPAGNLPESAGAEGSG